MSKRNRVVIGTFILLLVALVVTILILWHPNIQKREWALIVFVLILLTELGSWLSTGHGAHQIVQIFVVIGIAIWRFGKWVYGKVVDFYTPSNCSAIHRHPVICQNRASQAQ